LGDVRFTDPLHLEIHIAAAHNSEIAFLRPWKGNAYHLISSSWCPLPPEKLHFDQFFATG